MSTMNMKRILAAGVAAVTMFSLAACGSTAADPNKGHVYFLNGKPEVVDQLQQLAQDYTNQTGVAGRHPDRVLRQL
ncbi:ABC transporter substrate-binding protein [Bifidobacterium bifidum]|nr:ABC transporter substrate-binding protein [Bifidobacterium bifidum]